MSAPGKKDYYLKEDGSTLQRRYVDYLVKRLTDWRSAGQKWGQKFSGQLNTGATIRIARSQLGFDPYDPTRFNEACAYLKEKIDATVLGQRNSAKGVRNYHTLEEHGQPKVLRRAKSKLNPTPPAQPVPAPAPTPAKPTPAPQPPTPRPVTPAPKVEAPAPVVAKDESSADDSLLSLASAANCYTAAEIARALRRSKRGVLNALRNCPPSSVRIVHGNETLAWSLAALPERLRSEVATKAGKFLLSPEEYLQSPCKLWEPPLPLGQIAENHLEHARKLRDALLPALERRNAPTLSPAEKVQLGLADYKRAMGHPISKRHWQRLMDRTERRDAGRDDFARLELYLHEKPARKPALRAPASEHQHLIDTIESFADPTNPTPAETAALWSQVFEFFELAGSKKAQKRKRADLLTFLLSRLPRLAKSEHALRVAFDWKLAKWRKGNRTSAALLDGRHLKKGEQRAERILQDDLDIITAHATFKTGGRVAQAVRQLEVKGKFSGLSRATLELISRPHKSKSHVNRRLLAAVKPEVKVIAPYRLGKKAIDDSTAFVERDYSKLSSMQVISADDYTMPVYFYVPDGQGWFTLTRGQVLLFIDARSWKIVAWSLQPERNYNALVIRTLMNNLCREWGIPSTWYFECGIWKRAKLVKGTAPVGWSDAMSWPECKVGWEQAGVRFQHAIRARSKPAERVGGLLQDLMEGERGYCGRFERDDLPQVTKQAMEDVKYRRVEHPGELFMSFNEWESRLGQIIDQYNAESQDGRVLGGLSPDEAFEMCWPHDNPPSKFDANCWHLVAHYTRPVKVTFNGINFRIGSRSFVYRNERTGQDRFKTVIAWFDPECPDFLCVTDINKRNPYLVERATRPDFRAEPDDPVLRRELAKAAAHSAYPKARFHTLRAKFEPTFRRNLVDVETAELANEIRTQRETKVAEQKEQTRRANRARDAYGRLGMPMPETRRLRPEQPDAARRLAELLAGDHTERKDQDA